MVCFFLMCDKFLFGFKNCKLEDVLFEWIELVIGKGVIVKINVVISILRLCMFIVFGV